MCHQNFRSPSSTHGSRPAKPARQPCAGVAPARCGHALDHRAEQRLERVRGRLGADARVVDLDRSDRAAAGHTRRASRSTAGGSATCSRNHIIQTWSNDSSSNGLARIGLEAWPRLRPARGARGRSRAASARCRLRSGDAGELLSQNREHGAHAAPDLEQARSGLELCRRGSAGGASAPPAPRAAPARASHSRARTRSRSA